MTQAKIYVGNLPYSVDDNSLRDLFAQYGEVADAKVISDFHSGRSKGFGFVTFAESANVQEVIEKTNDMAIDGRNLKVNIAKEKTERSGGGDRGGRGGNGGGGRGGNGGGGGRW